MILFFGTRPGKTKLSQLLGVKCPYCEQMGTLTLTQTTNWFHFFWIALFKISTNMVAACSHCKRVYYKDEFTPAMKAGLDELKQPLV